MKLKMITSGLAAMVMVCSLTSASIIADTGLSADNGVETESVSIASPVEVNVSNEDSLPEPQKTEKPKLPLLEGIGTIVESGEIQVNGETQKLYRCFEDPTKAIEDLKAKIPSILDMLSAEYELQPLSDDNWEDYRDAMFMFFDSENAPEDYTESNVEFCTLRQFFDIYENSRKNERILEIVGDRNSKSSKSANTDDNADIDTELAFLLPYTEPLVQDYMSNGKIQARASTYNATKAVAYAKEYATNPNTPTYYYFHNGDCANFVSQILENSDVNQVVYDDTGKGWWHKRTGGFLGIYNHTHSESWSMADTFARYQGITSTSNNHNSFLINLYSSPTAFIVADFDSDADWDHCGFVTEVVSSGYKVAQHTSNYHEWTSTSTNNWDTIGDNGGRYARVRE